MITSDISELIEECQKESGRRPKRRPLRRLSGPRLTPAEKGHRVALAPVIDRLVRADDAQRHVAVERMKASAAPDVLALVLDLLTARAKLTPRADRRRGAVQALAQLGTAGLLRACSLALNGTTSDLRSAATEAVLRYGRTLPPPASAELYLTLIGVRANTADPRVAGVCEEILLALWGDDPILRHQLASFAPVPPDQPGARGSPSPAAG